MIVALFIGTGRGKQLPLADRVSTTVLCHKLTRSHTHARSYYRHRRQAAAERQQRLARGRSFMPMSCAWEPGQLAPAQLPHDILEKIVKLAIGYIASQKSSSNSSSSSSTEEHDVSSSIAPDAHLWLHSSFTLARAVCAAHVSRMAINVGLPSADSLQQFAGAFGAFPRLAALHELSLSLADTQLPPLLRVPAMATRLHALRSLSLITKVRQQQAACMGMQGGDGWTDI